jgi:hypothetical protein
MGNDQRNGDEAEARRVGQGRDNTPRGVVNGVQWQAEIGPEHARLTIGGRPIHVVRDRIGSFVTHEMVGRWRDIGELASAIIRYHPDYSPRPRRPVA